MIEKFNKNAKFEKFTYMLGIAVRLIVIDPYQYERKIIFYKLPLNIQPITPQGTKIIKPRIEFIDFDT